MTIKEQTGVLPHPVHASQLDPSPLRRWHGISAEHPGGTDEATRFAARYVLARKEQGKRVPWDRNPTWATTSGWGNTMAIALTTREWRARQTRRPRIKEIMNEEKEALLRLKNT